MILVTGANGQLGKLVVAELKKLLPAGEALAVSVRDPAKAGALKAQGIKVRRGDFDDKASLLAAFAGVRRALIISGDAPNDVRIRQHRTAIDAATEAGVGHIVYTSFIDCDPASPFDFAAIHHDTEAYLARSGVTYTVLRNGAYADMLQIFAARAAEIGSFALPAGAGKSSFISRADIARATAAVLASDRYAGQTLALTGEASVSYQEVANVLTRQLGKLIRYVASDAESYEAALLGAGLPAFLAKAITGIHRAVAEGRYDVTSTAVRDITGTPPEPVARFIEHSFPRAAA